MRYLVWTALPFCGAIFVACALPLWWLAWVLAAVCAVLFAAVLLAGRSRRTALSLLMAGACLGFCWSGAYTAAVVLPLRALDGQESAFTAEVTAYPTETDYGISVVLRIQSGSAQGRKALAYLDSWYDYLEPGDQLTGTAELTATAEEQDGEGSYYTASGIFLLADVEISSVYPAASVPLRYLPAWLGHELKQCIARLYTGQTGALLQGLLTGDESGLSDYLISCFRRAGMSHMLAVSGLHVGFLSSMIYLLPGRRDRRALIAIPVMICFALMTGGQSSTWRAVVMASLLLIAPLFHREDDPITSLSFALLLLLIGEPYASQSVGLQLSFAAMAGLVCFNMRLYAWMTRPLGRTRPQRIPARLLRRSLQTLAMGASTSCCALMFTLPLTAWHFGTISLVGPLANLCAVWAASLAFGLGSIGCLLCAFSPTAGALLSAPVSLLLHWLIAVAERLGGLSFAAVSVDDLYQKLWLVFSLAMLVLALCIPSLRRRPILPISSVTALLLLALALRMAGSSGVPLCVSALDVGQGACTVFSSYGSYVAVDCGGSDAGDELADYLQSGGVSELAVLVLTHYDSDHVDGAEELFSRIRVDTLVLPDVEDSSGNRETLTALARAAGCRMLWVEDETISVGFGEATLTIWPPVSLESDNAACLSALCTWEGHSVLVTGDLGQEQEALLLERETLPELDVLVVGHHGSASSSGARLLAALSPEIAVISVGGNSYGLPAQETMERLADYRCEIYRTDENGTVTLRFR